MGPLIQGFFSINIVGPPYPWVSHPQMGRANCMYCSKPLYIKDLSIRGLWYSQRGPGTSPPRTLKDNSVFRESKVIHKSSTAQGVGAPNSRGCSKVNCICICYTSREGEKPTSTKNSSMKTYSSIIHNMYNTDATHVNIKWCMDPRGTM